MPGRRFFAPRTRPPVETEPPPPVEGGLAPPPLESELIDAPPPDAAPLPPPPPGAPPRRPSPQRERRELARLREIEMRDVGGLAVEMARRNDWRYPLLHSRCAEVLAIEERIHELDAIIAAVTMAARGVPATQCQCGAPILHGSHFCAHCGRPAPETPPVATCSHCGQPLPAEANFCSVCGNSVAAEGFDEVLPVDDTMVAPVGREEPREGR
jgi:hypothetical protein